MKKVICVWMLVLMAGSGFCQLTTKSIPTKSASFYHPFFDNILISGRWIGEVYSPSGLELNLTNGKGSFALFDPKSNEYLFKFFGNTVNGIWDGYIYYTEKSKRGNLFIEGDFKSGLPNGKVICRLSNGNYFAGTFQFGKSFEKISLVKNNEAMSSYCNGFDFIQYINNDTSQFQKCQRQTTLDDPLYGAAIIISNIAMVSDKHATIDKFLECVHLNDVEIFIKNPDFALAGAEAIKSVLINPLWKNNSLEEIQEQLKKYLILNNFENLSKSIEFISFLSCTIEESRRL